MRASARLVVERGRGRTVARDVRSQSPLTLVPRRARSPSDDPLVVHLVSSATTPLGGDEVDLLVQVGPGARVRLRGTAATVALPGQRAGSSRARVRVEVAEGGAVEYLPEPTVVTAGADHRAELSVALDARARARCREVLVLGRWGEDAGRLVTRTEAVRSGIALLRQEIDLGDRALRDSGAGLAGARVLATEFLAAEHDPPRAASGPGWSLSPLAAGGAVTSVLAPDAITARHRLAEALAHHPDVGSLTG